MLKHLAAAATLVILGLSLPAFASPVTYDISGQQQNGTFSGSILYDPSTGIVSGGTIKAFASSNQAGSALTFTFSSDDQTGISSKHLGISTYLAPPDAPFAEAFQLDLDGTNAMPTISVHSNGATYILNQALSTDFVVSGTIAPHVNPAPPAAATPEPSSLVLLGTGLVAAAGAARRRFLPV